MLSCEFCQISKKTFFIEHLWTTGYILCQWKMKILIKFNKILILSMITEVMEVQDFFGINFMFHYNSR